MTNSIIHGIQQIGVGISDVHEAWKWYRENFGMDIKVFEEAATAEFMLPYTGGEPRNRHAVLAINMHGGGGFEIWQYTDRIPLPPEHEILIGDTGIFSAKIKSNNIQQAFNTFKERNLNVPGTLEKDPRGKDHFFVKDPYGNIFNVVACEETFKNENKLTGGTYGAIIGTTNMDRSIRFYQDILKYNKILYDGEDTFNDYSSLPGGKEKYRRVILTHKEKRSGGFSPLFGPSEIELVQALDRKPEKIFKDRFWGDLGFIHLCFDVKGMGILKKECEQAGHPFTIDSFEDMKGKSFDMGEAAGHFSYIEDPDGTLIEFVETHKIPVIKKFGWFLNIKKRKPYKSLPNWIIKAMSFNRVK
jgi:catechol 2,3-dioxygenase-like lactoylglutathione lyase family enzyme